MDEDPTQQLQAMAEEVTPKPTLGPSRSEKLATVLDAMLSEPEFAKIMKLC